MRLNWLSNKGSSAPIVYLLLHTFIITGLIFTCPSILDLSNSQYLLLFWIDAAITITLFFIVHRTDPGYVPFDGVFFTDQEEPPLSASNCNVKYDSMMKLKAADSRIMYPGFDLSPSAMDNNEMKQKMFLTQKSPKDKSQFLRMTIGSTAVSKNVKDTLNSPGMDNMDREGDGSHRQDGENEEYMDQTRVDADLSQEDITQRNYEMEYQVSANREGEAGQEYQKDSPFNDMSHIEDTPKGRPESPVARFEAEATATKKSGHMNQFQGKYGLQLDDVEEDEQNENTNTPVRSKRKKNSKTVSQQSEQGDYSRQQVYQDQESGKENEKENTLEHISQEAIHEDPTLRGIKPKDEGYLVLRKESSTTANLMNGTFNQLDMSQQAYLVRNKMEIPKEKIYSNNIVIKVSSGESNDAQDQESGKGGNNDKEAPESAKIEQKALESLYIERRYCTACNLDQPLRSKHCRDCGKCVAQYDHHCPWLGTCIGEKNHLFFFFFLIFQLIEIVWGETKLIQRVVERSNEEGGWTGIDIWRIVVLVPASFFMIMVGSLSILNVYLAAKNLTTWEFLSWAKISYLKDWQPSWGSPFSKGVRENLKFFFSRHKDLTRWKMPKYKAPLNQQNVVN